MISRLSKGETAWIFSATLFPDATAWRDGAEVARAFVSGEGFFTACGFATARVQEGSET